MNYPRILASLMALLMPVHVWAQDAVSLDTAYTADVWHNAQGGLERGTRYLDNLDVQLSIDLDALAAISRTTVFAYGLYNNGTRFSENLVGDAQVVSNIETGVRAARLYEAWVDHTTAGGRLSIRAGLYDFNSEFDVLDSAGLFTGAAHGIGTDISQAGENGPSIFPSTSLAARLSLNLSQTLLVRLAALDGVPGDPGRPKRTTILLGNGDGALLAGEVQWSDGTSKLLLGYWRHTARFEDSLATTRTGNAVSGTGNDGLYLRGETRLLADAKGEGGLALFARIGGADSRYNPFSRFYSIGAVYDAPLAGRPEDQIGVALAWAQTGGRLRSLARLLNEPVDPREISLEATYRAPLTDWLTIQPALHYIINPGLDPATRNALAIGLRTELSWSF